MTNQSPTAPESAARQSGPSPRRPLFVCAALLLLFALLSYGAILGKSATFDEPLNAVGGFVKLHLGDHRVDQADPALFGYLAALPHSASALKIDTADESYHALIADSRKEWGFAIGALFHTPTPDGEVRSALGGIFRQAPRAPPSNTLVSSGLVLGDVTGQPLVTKRDGHLIMMAANGQSVQASQLVAVVMGAEHFLNTSRLVFTVLALGLGALICWWAWKLAGPAGAIVATALFALDPNFLAHSSLVKNDVLFAALLLALAYVVWQFGRRGTVWGLVLIAIICAAGLNIKFSAVLFGPIIVLLLAIRAWLPAPWLVWRKELGTVGRRMAIVPIASVFLLGASWAGTWANYGFRYAPMSDGTLFDPTFLVEYSASSELTLARANTTAAPPTMEEIRAKAPSAPVSTTLWLMDHHVLPQAWLNGFLYTYASTMVRPNFLLGKVNQTGWWYYFPLAMLFKTPLATLIAATLALVAWARQRDRQPHSPQSDGDVTASGLDPWTTACLLVPPAVYAASALTSHLNIGIRHVLPLYPFAFIGIAVIAARMLSVAARPTRVVCGTLALVLVIETLGAFPNYIPFFNVAARHLPGADGGLHLLGDSNIDWGQDLPLLAEWQKRHQDRGLYLSYFGTADPQYYGIRYINLPFGYSAGPPPADGIDPSAYLAISAMNLQGTESGDFYRSIREGDPMGPNNLRPRLLEVLGGTIYVYEWRP